MKNFFLGLLVSVIVLGSVIGGIFLERFRITKSDSVKQQVLIGDENRVISVSEKASESVVTVSVTRETLVRQPFVFDPFGVFEAPDNKSEKVQKDIGTGFVVDKDGLIVTNKHVVSDTNASYKVITKDNTEYEVKKIYRDPVNDLAIIKVDPKKDKNLVAIALGDSNQLKVGQYVVAIGTALGEFRSTLTQGVISGLGRGITAGDMMMGQSEQLENVIQTDAAINPGNSGGPLLNLAAEVIGVNVAVAGNAQGIGFAIPINVVKDSLNNFEQTGQFNRPQLGVRYRMLDKDTAVLNDLPEGAYIVEVLSNSSAEKAGLKRGDIIISMNGKKVKEIKGGLAGVVSKMKVDDTVEIEYYRGESVEKVKVTLLPTQ